MNTISLYHHWFMNFLIISAALLSIALLNLTVLLWLPDNASQIDYQTVVRFYKWQEIMHHSSYLGICFLLLSRNQIHKRNIYLVCAISSFVVFTKTPVYAFLKVSSWNIFLMYGEILLCLIFFPTYLYILICEFKSSASYGMRSLMVSLMLCMVIYTLESSQFYYMLMKKGFSHDIKTFTAGNFGYFINYVNLISLLTWAGFLIATHRTLMEKSSRHVSIS